MAARGRPRRRRVLSVVFDTNAIFNKEFDTLVSQATKNLITEHSNHGDLSIRWVIPEIVRDEREYQMRNEYRGISSHVTKAESLFGEQWGITQEAVEQRITVCIAEELREQRIEIVPCNPGRVDWADVMRRSCFREPPFERGQTEKGFRDAVVCETFVQLATDLMGGDTAVLVSNDRLIKQYIESCEVQGNRARVVNDLKALHDEIQLRVANVDENTQAFIEKCAQRLFYPWGHQDDPKCLWNRERLHEKIMAQYGERLKQVPTGFEYVLIGHEIWNARLVSKDGARVHFESTYAIQSGFRYWVPAANVPQDGSANQLVSLANPLVGSQPAVSHQISKRGLLDLLPAPAAGEWKQITKAEKDRIAIRWSATFSRHRTLTRSTIDAIDFVAEVASNPGQ